VAIVNVCGRRLCCSLYAVLRPALQPEPEGRTDEKYKNAINISTKNSRRFPHPPRWYAPDVCSAPALFLHCLSASVPVLLTVYIPAFSRCRSFSPPVVPATLWHGRLRRTARPLSPVAAPVTGRSTALRLPGNGTSGRPAALETEVFPTMAGQDG